MIDHSTEKLLTLAEAADSLPMRPHVTTLWRWHLRGVRRTKLETILLGGQRFTSEQAIQRFFAKLNAATPGSAPSMLPSLGNSPATGPCAEAGSGHKLVTSPRKTPELTHLQRSSDVDL